MRDGRLNDVAVDWFHSLMRDTPTMRNELAATPDLFHWRKGINPEGLGGHGFKMTETLSNGTEATFWTFVARNEDGTLTVTLRVRPPRG